MNERYRVFVALKGVLSIRGLGITAKKYQYRVIVPIELRTALNKEEGWIMRSAERRKVNVLKSNLKRG